MTIEELVEIVEAQNERIVILEGELRSLKEWSDLNDYWLREMIDALTDTVESNIEKIKECKNLCEKIKKGES